MWWLVPAAAVAAAWLGWAWWHSLQVNPWRKCRACGGSGKTRSRIAARTGTCPGCRGGRVPALAVRVLQPGRAREMRPAKDAHKRADWRRR